MNAPFITPEGLEITEHQFECYVSCQMSGVTNMIDLRMVGDLTNLERETIIQIQANYSALKFRFPNVAKAYEPALEAKTQ